MITIHNYQEFNDLLANNKTVLVDFFATWCGPCKMIHPILEELASEAEGKYAVAEVDVDLNEDITDSFLISSVPTLIYFRDGNLVKKEPGIRTKEEILSNIKQYL